MIQPVILCGGSGTRLWPLSRKSFPKQFVPLIDGKSLLQLTLQRVLPLSDSSDDAIVCVGAEDHRFLIAEAMEAASTKGAIILEPVARNTAAAMALAALHAEDDAQLLFCPADHHIPDISAFVSMVRKGASAAAAGSIVTFGVTPSFPSTAYGYIERGERLSDGSCSVAAFIEKPDLERAQAMLLAGQVLWNAGIFLCTAGTLLKALEQACARHSCRLSSGHGPGRAGWHLRAARGQVVCILPIGEHRLRRDGAARRRGGPSLSTASGATWAAGTQWPT